MKVAMTTLMLGVFTLTSAACGAVKHHATFSLEFKPEKAVTFRGGEIRDVAPKDKRRDFQDIDHCCLSLPSGTKVLQNNTKHPLSDYFCSNSRRLRYLWQTDAQHKPPKFEVKPLVQGLFFELCS